MVSKKAIAELAGDPLQAKAPKVKGTSYKRLNAEAKGYIIRQARAGVSQVEIAKALGCTQASVSEWLTKCQDTGEAALARLKGAALPIAERHISLLEKSKNPKPLQDFLESLDVLERDAKQQGVSVHVGGNLQIIGKLMDSRPVEVDTVEAVGIVPHRARYEDDGEPPSLSPMLDSDTGESMQRP